MIMLSKRNQESRACQMRTKDVIQSLVGTKKMVVKDFFLEAETNAFVIAARPTKTEQCRCSRCHCKAKYYDGGRGARRWRTLDIGSSKAFVEASAPRVCCKKHGVVVADVPWARLNMRFFSNKVSTRQFNLVCSAAYVLTEFYAETFGVAEQDGRVYDARERTRREIRSFGAIWRCWEICHCGRRRSASERQRG